MYFTRKVKVFFIVCVIGVISYMYINTMPPRNLTPIYYKPSRRTCRIETCFNYSRCPVLKTMKYFLQGHNIQHINSSKIQKFLLNSKRKTNDISDACITIHLVSRSTNISQLELELKSGFNENKNIIIWIEDSNNKNTSGSRTELREYKRFLPENFYEQFDNVMIITNSLTHIENFRENYDIWIPTPSMLTQQLSKNNQKKCNERKYTAFFDGLLPWPKKLREVIEKSFYNSIQFITCNSLNVEFCSINSILKLQSYEFGVLYLTESASLINTTRLQLLGDRLLSFLNNEIIPVLICNEPIILPLSEIIPWSKILIKLPLQRAADIPTILLQISSHSRQIYRNHARTAVQTFFKDTKSIVDSVLLILEKRLHIPGIYFNSVNQLSYSNTPKSKLITIHRNTENFEKFFQPLILPAAETKSKQPFMETYENNIDEGYRNRKCLEPEKFTIVMLTYNRTNYLPQALLSLSKTFKELHKVVIIWNNKNPPETNIKWPNISVPIEIIHTKRNSLNNRFYPYEQIETDGIFSIDDDVSIPQEQLVHGFNVWKANRDKLVGYPNRGLKWSGRKEKWYYTTKGNTALILTGGTFLHKYYYYYYTYEMDQLIRDKVDELMNCEDIAMNFLVSHLTNEPPIKAITKEPFKCLNCGNGRRRRNSLGDEPSHYKERSFCVNFLAKIYGYNPLRFTTFRAYE